MGALARLIDRAFPGVLDRSGQEGGPSPAARSRTRSGADRTAAGHEVADVRAVWAASSWLVDYPGDETLERLPELRRLVSELPGTFRTRLDPVLDALSARAVDRLRAEYVETFDTRRKGCLHLTYFSHGDTRRRGLALVRVKETYRRAGLLVEDTELPDHLTLVLEFGAGHDHAAAEKILLDNRAGLELLRLHLSDIDSPWHGVVDAVCSTLPPLDGEDREAVARLVEQGPPEETVGLSGYGDHDMPPLLHDDGCSGHDHAATDGSALSAAGHPLLPLTAVDGRR